MSQRAPSGYGIGGPANPYAGAPSVEQDGGVLEQIRPYTDKVEDMLDSFSEPIKP
jgi:hypothetical protein